MVSVNGGGFVGLLTEVGRKKTRRGVLLTVPRRAYVPHRTYEKIAVKARLEAAGFLRPRDMRREGVRKLLEQMQRDMVRRVPRSDAVVRVSVQLELTREDLRALCKALERVSMTRLAIRAWGRAILRVALDHCHQWTRS